MGKKMKKLLLISLLPVTVWADRYHEPVTIYHETETIRTIESTENIKGIALGISQAQLHCSDLTENLQGTAGIGVYEGEEAFSAGLCKKKGDLMFRGSVGVEDGNYGGGLGINWRWR